MYIVDCFESLVYVMSVIQLYIHNFHSCTVHFDVIKVIYLPTDAQ